jgi:hypothetical protein
MRARRVRNSRHPCVSVACTKQKGSHEPDFPRWLAHSLKYRSSAQLPGSVAGGCHGEPDSDSESEPEGRGMLRVAGGSRRAASPGGELARRHHAGASESEMRRAASARAGVRLSR